jgi:hypothetical protein
MMQDKAAEEMHSVQQTEDCSSGVKEERCVAKEEAHKKRTTSDQTEQIGGERERERERLRKFEGPSKPIPPWCPSSNTSQKQTHM